MPRYTCECGVRYRFPDSAVGKRGKCDKCGAVFTLEPDEEGPIPIADEPPVVDEFAAAAERVSAAVQAGVQSRSGPPTLPPGVSPPVVVIESASEEASSGLGGYFGALLSTLVFVKRPHNLVIFIIVWALLCLEGIILPAARLIGIVGIWIILGWYCAFRFEVIVEASAGEQDLPVFNPTAGGWEGILLPLFRWIGSWAIVFVPALLVFFVTAGIAGSLSVATLGTLLSGGVSGMVQGTVVGGAIVFVVLVLAGLFIWPLFILCVAIGGFATVSRVDLMIATIIKTFPIYLLTVAIVFGTEFTEPVFARLPGGHIGRVLAIGIELYLELVALRAIGLYYHYFKHQFAWSWE